jgi:hypothetical protein
MALIAAQTIAATGTVVTFTAVNASDTFVGDDRQVLHVKNGGGGSINVTLVDSGLTPAGNAGTSQVVAVGAGAEKEIAVPRSLQNTSGICTVNYSGTTTVTAALKKYP